MKPKIDKPEKKDSKYLRIIWRIIALVLSGGIAVAMLLDTGFLSFLFVFIICAPFGDFCNGDNGALGPALLGLLLSSSLISAIILKLLSRLPWLVCFGTGIASLSFQFFLGSQLGDKWWKISEVIPYFIILFIITSFIIHGFLFITLSRWRWGSVIAIILLVSLYLGLPIAQDKYRQYKIWNKAAEIEVKKAQELSFKLYKPTYIPKSFHLWKSGIKEENVSYYLLAYSHKPFSATPDYSFYIRQYKPINYNPPTDCLENLKSEDRTILSCKKIKTLKKCDVYQMGPSLPRQCDANGCWNSEIIPRYYCRIGETLIDIETSSISPSEVTDIFDSLLPMDKETVKVFIN